MVRLGYVAIAIAAVIGFRALLDAGDGPVTATAPPVRPSTTLHRPHVTVPRVAAQSFLDAVATDSDHLLVGGSPGAAGSWGASPPSRESTIEPGQSWSDDFEVFRYRAGRRTYDLIGLRPGLRPSPNQPPDIAGPEVVARSGTGSTPIGGVVASDPDHRGSDVGVLLVAEGGGLTVGRSSSIRFLGRATSNFIAFVGTLDAVNAVLAGLAIEPSGDRTVVTVLVSDFGNGDLRAEQIASREITVR